MPLVAKEHYLAKRHYKIFETDQFQNDLTDLTPVRASQFRRKLLEYVYPQLREEPHFGLNIKRLRNWDPPTWRNRLADWRIFYEIDETDRLVLVTALAHRKDAYR